VNFLSLIFVAFFIFSFLTYWNLPKRFRVFFLIAVSVFYYGFYSLPFLLHFLIVIAINYLLARRIAASGSRATLIFGVAVNILHLVFFKYANSAIALIAPHTGIAAPATLKIMMPLAISFYTFQFIAFQVDVFKKQVNEVAAGKFFLFMLFFPHLISGPILRSGDFYSQVGNEVESKEGQTRGLYLIALGLIKKLFIADVLGYLINPVFKAPAEYGSIDTLLAIFGYSAQIYCDFSGFIDIARGMAKMFGYDMPVNFRSPYFSTSFSELWTRWHITLSAFIREYIYFPLGGNRVGPARQYLNLFAAMVLSGIWHGETLNFLIWGILHGLFLCVEKILKVGKSPSNSFWWLVRNLWVVIGWSFAFVFFRASDFKSALSIIMQVFVWKAAALTVALVLSLIILTWVVQYLEMRRDVLLGYFIPRAKIWVPVLMLVIIFLIARIQIPNEAFIYVQF
jgi:alginate O-acetyltransferase complex protein AlgI